MTAQAHDHSTHAAPATTGSARPRWLVPALVVVVVGSLVVFGVLSPSVVLYGGLIGGMVLMHAGGHGAHGGHGGPGGGATHQGHDGGTPSDAKDLSHRSHGSQPGQPGSDAAPQDRASSNPNGIETQDHDQHSSHGCH